MQNVFLTHFTHFHGIVIIHQPSGIYNSLIYHKSPLRQYIANPTSTVIHPVFQPLKAPTTHSQRICALFILHADDGEV